MNNVSNLSLGLPQANGNWTGLLGELQHGRVHVIPQLLMDNSRRNVADFSQPFTKLGYLIFILPFDHQYISHFDGTKTEIQFILCYFPFVVISTLHTC